MEENSKNLENGEKSSFLGGIFGKKNENNDQKNAENHLKNEKNNQIFAENTQFEVEKNENADQKNNFTDPKNSTTNQNNNTADQNKNTAAHTINTTDNNINTNDHTTQNSNSNQDATQQNEKQILLEEMRKKMNFLKGKLDALSEDHKELESTKEAAIKKAVEDAKTQIEKTYNQKIVELDSILKREKNNKEKEKVKIIKEKIDTATKDIKERIYYTKRNINAIIKERNLSPLINTDLYFSLVSPKTVGSYAKGVLIILITIIIIPSIIVFLRFKNDTFWIKLMVYIINLFLWSVVFFFFIKLTETTEQNVREIRQMRKDIKDDEKTISKLTKEIKKEKIEGNTAYDKFDQNIENINLNIKDLQEKKKIEIDKLENEKLNEIRNKIEKESAKEFKENEKETKKVKEEYEKLEREYALQKI